MNRETQALRLDGPVGPLQAALDLPPGGASPRGLLVACHPHPQHGGTMDNKVVQTVVRASTAEGWAALRFNVRGAGESAGHWDEGRGEIDDAMAAIAWGTAQAAFAGLPLALAGFSFGGYVAASAAERLAHSGAALAGLVLVAPATSSFSLPPVPAATLVLHGDDDEVVPLSATLAWARPQSLAVTVLPGVGHFFHGHLGWLRQLVQPAMARFALPASTP